MHDANPQDADLKKWEIIGSLEKICRLCGMCYLGTQQSLGFDPHVFSTMKDSKFMVVGQNPGKNECLRGEPFVGAAGANFDSEIAKHGLSRADFYITNTVKCFTQDNRSPTDEEKFFCEPFLRMEIAVLDPSLIVTLGSHAFGVLCPDVPYSESLGTCLESKKYGKWVMPIYHPSPTNLSNKGRMAKFQKDVKRMCEIVKALRSRNP